jgi:hypothetical protein
VGLFRLMNDAEQATVINDMTRRLRRPDAVGSDDARALTPPQH